MGLEHSFWFIQFKDLLTLLVLAATIFAIVWGPIKAVQITRANDDAREKLRRRFEVFHSLMKTRRFALSPEHVMALNLVQVDFYQHARIDAAYRTYMALLSREPPPTGDPIERHFYGEQEDALYDLLHEIGAELGYQYDKRDLRKLAYGPRGWENDEVQLRIMRGLLVELLAGRRPMPIADWEKLVAAKGRFPPPPKIDH
jgi:hypothetical protein